MEFLSFEFTVEAVHDLSYKMRESSAPRRTPCAAAPIPSNPKDRKSDNERMSIPREMGESNLGANETRP